MNGIKVVIIFDNVFGDEYARVLVGCVYTANG